MQLYDLSVYDHSVEGKRIASGSRYATLIKRALDVLFVLLAVPVVLPVIGLLALSVRRDGGSVFFVQERVGRGGQIFRLWKLRSMVVDAEARLAEHLAREPQARAEWEMTQKLVHDPRVTAVGRWLRRWSLDELPQLWNVLRGDMSLVGPRPMLPSQQPLYPGRAYYRLRPGLTGPWQISVRHASEFADRAVYDAQYERGLSLKLDLSIMVRTLGVMCRGAGC